MPILEEKKRNYRNPVLTVDIIVQSKNGILIERRGIQPFKGMYCLPGGHVEYGERVEDAALRELKEECGINSRLISILGVYSDPKRDPRGHYVSTVFVSKYTKGKIKAGDDARSAKWIKLSSLFKMKSKIAFDHYLILRAYSKWVETGETFWSSKNI